MVVQVNPEQQRCQGATSVFAGGYLTGYQYRYRTLTSQAGSPASGPATSVDGCTHGDITSPSLSRSQTQILTELPSYDATDPAPNSPLITHLCETFFLHLGCNYPFLQRDKFMRDLEEKQVDAILVDAVCALAARFSTHPLLTTPNTDGGDSPDASNKVHKAEYGQAFAHRAMSAVVGSFSCPRITVVQACLLLAYEQFGSNRDSGLWMYLGIAIRMAQDLGLQKLEGIRFEGWEGSTSKATNGDRKSGIGEKRGGAEQLIEKLSSDDDLGSIDEQKANERERIDTFWAVFFLDRVISSGTGRPVTLRDKDIELSFPSLEEVDTMSGWPVPFPALIRIIHLYGRVTDLLNSIRDVNHVTPETLQRLAGIEKDLTGTCSVSTTKRLKLICYTDIYQGLSPKLHFNAVNFQHYVKNEQGTNFILLHFWFHTLIVLLHQPTLLNSYEGRIQQLFPNSRELSMSSAKTIADILAFAELMDARSFIGNPFTSQPMYIAACAFLLESAAHTTSQPQSRSTSPPRYNRSEHTEPAHSSGSTLNASQPSMSSLRTSKQIFGTDYRSSAKHTLLATAANQNYQRCYKALKSLEIYWAGTKYIVTVLDQKAKGIGDPLLYTSEEMDSALELPRQGATSKTQGWIQSMQDQRRPGTITAYSGNQSKPIAGKPSTNLASSKVGPNQGQHLPSVSSYVQPSKINLTRCSPAIGWSLTGTTNSQHPSLSFLYQATNGATAGPTSSVPPSHDPTSQAYPIQPTSVTTATSGISGPATPTKTPNYTVSDLWPTPQHPALAQGVSPSAKYDSLTSNPVTTSDAEMLLGLHSPYTGSSPQPTPTALNPYTGAPLSMHTSNRGTYNSSHAPHPIGGSLHTYPTNGIDHSSMGGTVPTFADMMIESQDIDMTAFGGDMAPWLEYLPQDVLSFFDGGDGGMGLNER